MEEFLKVVQWDPRIGISHIGLYAVLFTIKRSDGSIELFARQVIPLAKIAARSTYYRLMRELEDYGYLMYEPSSDPRRPSRIELSAVKKIKP